MNSPIPLDAILEDLRLDLDELCRLAGVEAPWVCTHVDDGLLALCEGAGVRGTLILAGEGVNGTIAGTRDQQDDSVMAVKGSIWMNRRDWARSSTEDLRRGPHPGAFTVS